MCFIKIINENINFFNVYLFNVINFEVIYNIELYLEFIKLLFRMDNIE